MEAGGVYKTAEQRRITKPSISVVFRITDDGKHVDRTANYVFEGYERINTAANVNCCRTSGGS